jgi:hypothetical protein
MANRNLATYLNDHLAGSTTAVELLDRVADIYRDITPAAIALREEIEADRAELRTLLENLDVSESRTRKVGGWLAEKVTQLKLRIDDRSAGSLRLLESLEAVALGIDGKSALWKVLDAVSPSIPPLKDLDYKRLISRADDQRKQLEVLRLEAGKAALVSA